MRSVTGGDKMVMWVARKQKSEKLSLAYLLSKIQQKYETA